MAETSGISWTRSTFNPWIGCTKVGPGCDHCYAEVSTPARTMKVAWGPGEARQRTKVSNWNKPLKWDRLCAEEKRTGIITPGHEAWRRPGFWPVFCASLADVFDNEVSQEWRDDLWHLIESTPNLSWLLVTKRIGNVAKMVPERWMRDGFPSHVRIMITVVNQEEADRDIPKLLALRCKNGISYEPALGPVDWPGLNSRDAWCPQCKAIVPDSLMDPHDAKHGCLFSAVHDPAVHCSAVYDMLGWIIIGGESDQGGAKARPFDIQWARDTIFQFRKADIPVFVKQLGSKALELVETGADDHSGCNCREAQCPHTPIGGMWKRVLLQDRAGADPAEWPAELRVQEFPE